MKTEHGLLLLVKGRVVKGEIRGLGSSLSGEDKIERKIPLRKCRACIVYGTLLSALHSEERQCSIMKRCTFSVQPVRDVPTASHVTRVRCSDIFTQLFTV